MYFRGLNLLLANAVLIFVVKYILAFVSLLLSQLWRNVEYLLFDYSLTAPLDLGWGADNEVEFVVIDCCRF
jgi:hypothetical protein